MQRKNPKGLCLLAISLLWGLVSHCSSWADEQASGGPLLVRHPPEATGITFSNTLYETSTLNIVTYEYLYNGAGVGIGDINQDGLPDVYLSGNMVEGKLFLNRGNLKFKDITASAGLSTKDRWGTGVSMADVNADGLLDIYLCFSGPFGPERRRNQLYINQGDGTFSEEAKAYGLDDPGHTVQAAFLDYDRDGDLDVYLLNNTTDELGPNVIRPKRNRGEMLNTDRLLRNDDGRFFDASAEAGIQKEGYGLGLSLGDVNQDGWVDIFVSNDYLSNDLLYINGQDGTFTDQAPERLRHSSYSSMGSDMADLNNDARPDLVALDMLPPDNERRKLMIGSIRYNRFLSELRSGYFPQYMRNTLQLNLGVGPDNNLVFSEIGQYAGIHSTDWSWSPLLADIDNDGWKDLLVTNGYPRDITNLDFASYKADLLLKNKEDLREVIAASGQLTGAYLPNVAFRNRGGITFADASVAWGFDTPSFSHGAALADLDGDGDLDYIANNSYDPVFVYENTARQSNGHHYLRLRLNGPKGNPFALGAKAWVYRSDQLQYQELYPVRGYQSTLEPILHFGLGEDPTIDSLRVQWPGDHVSTVYTPAPDQVLTLSFGEARPPNGQPGSPPAATPLLEPAPPKQRVPYRHTEPHYADFQVMPLLPHKHSQAGPLLSSGDVNGDGREDVFIGGAFRQPDRLFRQQADGSFAGTDLDPSDATPESLGSAFFDADGDGDLDLYLCRGGSEFPDGADQYQDRLYRNDGGGRFTHAPDALPAMTGSTGCVRPADIDADGDLDLFVGGLVIPGRYPDPPRSYILENREGRFFDNTAGWAPELARVGMVRDAAWTDLDSNGQPDLILAGEWLPISVFLHEGDRLSNRTQEWNLDHTVGWWNRLHLQDLDGDGDQDIIAGNLGRNAPFQASPQNPLSLHLGDIDRNGLTDPIITYVLNGERVPLAYRDDLLAWVQPLRKRFPSYRSYAQAAWPDLFPGISFRRVDAHTLASAWFEHVDNQGFIRHELPGPAQWAPIFAIETLDLNADGHMDVLLTGNTSAPEPTIGAYDAFNGLVLLGDGQGRFRPLSFQESGFFVPGEGRDLVVLPGPGANSYRVLASQNNDALLTFHLTVPLPE